LRERLCAEHTGYQKMLASTCRSVGLSVSLCVCLFAVHRSQFKSNVHQTLNTCRHQSGKELKKFWYSYASGSGSGTFLGILQHCEIGHLATIFAHISDRIFEKIIITDVSMGKDFVVKFRNLAYSDLDYESGLRTRKNS